RFFMHFIAFLINLAIWTILGYYLGKKGNKVKAGTLAGLFGGLFGFLVNGLPNSTFSLTNFIYALVFSFSAVSVNNPKFIRKLDRFSLAQLKFRINRFKLFTS
ncbi:MAG: hypothetical protein US07_C0006G0001, partial [Candidatus Levybacteria bacterium GW2011_GWB1_36_18]